MTSTDRGRAADHAVVLSLALTLVACTPALRDPGPAPIDSSRPADPAEVQSMLARAEGEFAQRTMHSVRRAVEHWLEAASADGGRADGWIGVVRARAWLADHETERAVRKEEARNAVEAGQWCEDRVPDDPRCTYWLAVAIGVQARERQSTALDGVDKMIERLRQVIEVAPELDHGGPHRILALVYLRAPGWPTGPGNPDEGLQEAGWAVEIAPEYPPNQLCLAEAREAVENPQGALEATEEALRLARERVAAGVPGADEWLAEAEERRDRLDGS